MQNLNISSRQAKLFEGIEKEVLNSKRNRLVGKHHFGGVYQKQEELWTEVNEYIEACYDTEYLEKIYILGDQSKLEFFTNYIVYSTI